MGVGFGYGLAHALSAVPGAQLRANQYNAAEDLRQRQMKVNEDAEQRAEDLAKEYIAQSSDQRALQQNRIKGGVMGQEVIAGYGAQKPIVASAPGSPEEASSETPVQSVSGDEPLQFDAMGNMVLPTEGGKTVDAMGMEAAPAAEGIGKAGPGVKPMGQMPGMPTKGVTPPKGKTPGYAPSAPASSVAAPSAKSQDLLRQGKSSVAPAEVQGLMSQADDLQAQASGIEDRLASAVKSLESQYGHDATALAYMKSGLYAEVRPQIAQLKMDAARARQNAQFAGFAHEAGSFAESMLSHLERGGRIDDSWINTVKPIADKLGIDVGMLSGLHKNERGAIVNAQGYVWPRKAIAKIANASLPWNERFSALDDIDKMMKTQEDIKLRWARLRQTDPNQALIGVLDMVKKNQESKRKADLALGNMVDWFSKDTSEKRPLRIRTADGEGNVTVPAISGIKNVDDLRKLANDNYPMVKAIYNQLVEPNLKDSEMSDTMLEFLGGFGKAHVKMHEFDKTPEEIEAEAQARSQGTAEGRSYVEQKAAWVKGRNAWNTNPANAGKAYPIPEPTEDWE